MIVAGALLLILGIVFGIGSLADVGVILLIIGAVLAFLGGVDRPVAGRRWWY